MTTSRLSVRLPADAKDELDNLAEKFGVKRGAFYAMALSLGARQLRGQMEPEKFLTPEIAKMIAEAVKE